MTNDPTPVAPERKRPAWPRNAALALAAAALTFFAFRLAGTSEAEEEPAVAAASPAASASPSAVTSPAASASASAPAAVSTGASASAKPLSTRPVVALDVAFPKEVKDPAGGVYTRVGAVTLKSCTEPDSVGPRLIAMIEQGKGCLGQHVALYKDAADNQFNFSVFTMKDPVDALHLTTELSMRFDDYQVGAQAPPPGSGLATLAPDSGMVQAFNGAGRAMVAGLGQWSDGRTADYQKLVDRLEPLLKGVGDAVAAHERAG